MDRAREELADLVTEFVQRGAGRPRTPDERAGVADLLNRLDEVRATLASTLATSPAEGTRAATATIAGRRSDVAITEALPAAAGRILPAAGRTLGR